MSELKVRKHKGGLAFYIDGNLQFDTRDEKIYHESLVLPAALLAQRRFRRPVTALVLGGGDGLALRELLKFGEVAKADLVDHDPEVLALGRGVFARYNKGSLSDPRATINCSDAREYLRTVPLKYDIVLADFTFPDDLAGCSLFTEDFFRRVGAVLSRRGLFAMNAVSPEKFSPGYWAIYKTLRAAGLYPRPLSADIPSFSSHGYGKWGFFFSSPRAITGRELAELRLPASAAFLTGERLRANMKFEKGPALFGAGISRPVADPSELLALLNLPEPAVRGSGDLLDFFSRTNRSLSGGGFPGDPALWSGETLAAWEDRINIILSSFDWEQLLADADRLSGRVSEKLRTELEELKAEYSPVFSGAGDKAERIYRVLAVLAILLIMINMAYPDNAFAKGYSSHSGGSSDVDVVFISNKAPSPYHGIAFQLMSRPTGVVPDSAGYPHPKKSVTFSEDYAAVKPGVSSAAEPLYYSVTDNVQITASGNVFMVLFPLPYVLKIEPGRFVLLKEGSPEPLFSFNPDPSLVHSLSLNVTGQISAVEKALSDHRKWLAWAGPSGLILPPIKAESEEARNLAVLKLALQKASVKLAGPGSDKLSVADDLSRLTAEGDNREIIDTAKKLGFTRSQGAPTRLIPGLYLTDEGALILTREDGSPVSYPMPGLRPADDTVIMRPNNELTAFMRRLLVSKAASLPPDNPGRRLGEMSDDAYNEIINKR